MPIEASVVPRPPPDQPPSEQLTARYWLTILLFAALGGFVAWLGLKFGGRLAAADALRQPEAKWLKLLPVLTMPLSWLLAVAVHEFGHLVGGWLTGGRFLLYIVGPLKWVRTPNGIGFEWNRSLGHWGGLASCLPQDPANITPGRIAVMIAGGPVASVLLALGAAGLTAGLMAAGVGGVGWSLTLGFLRAVSLMSVIIGLVTVLPSTLGGFKSDGRRFFDLLRGDRRSQQEKAMLALTAAVLAGVRPADLDDGLLAEATALRDGSVFDLLAHFTAYQQAADRGEITRAQARLDTVCAGEGQLPPFLRAVVRCEYAWLLATRSDAVAMARAWLDSAGPLQLDPATRCRAEAAVLLAEGRKAEAADRARAGLHALQHQSLNPVGNPFAQEMLEELLARATA